MHRSSLSPTPPNSSPARPPRSSAHQSRGSGSQPSSSAHPQVFYKGDEYLMEVLPGWKPMTEAELHQDIKYHFPEANDGNIQEYINDMNQCVEEVKRLGGVRAIGVKPRRGDWNLFSVRIPDSDYTIRMWNGGMEAYNQFCLDFYDHRCDVPVNLPPGFSLGPSPVNMQGVFGMAGPLVSWEQAMGIRSADIPAGEEKWSVPEGTYLVVRRADRPGQDFTFAVPRRQTPQAEIAQPVYGRRP
ncbi:hypothetical protein BD310DRAFT_989850 [Dichomitus squalens]|uniref:Uncharacterized protein n=1 Tax=Dichomitus squalens TaxID=114155 RepID=A0A4Q9PIX1_9APHY|nr:hypothetical protein BD310DRAFT_989837 [Dichomitus squalens]TBU54014.1 hypothetical protein BD310DRAFT_989850 [Dichomitus squalens]